MRSRARNNRGFTILELIVTIVVISILVAIALPGMRDLMGRNKVSTEVNRLVSDLLLARNTAITRGTFVTICRSGDQSSCLAASAANEFEQGWMTYAAPATRVAFNSAVAGNELLKVGEAASPEIQVHSLGSQAPAYITYLATGRIDPAVAGNIVITICLNGESTAQVPGRRLTLSVSGRPALSEVAAGSCT